MEQERKIEDLEVVEPTDVPQETDEATRALEELAKVNEGKAADIANLVAGADITIGLKENPREE